MKSEPPSIIDFLVLLAIGIIAFETATIAYRRYWRPKPELKPTLDSAQVYWSTNGNFGLYRFDYQGQAFLANSHGGIVKIHPDHLDIFLTNSAIITAIPCTDSNLLGYWKEVPGSRWEAENVK